MRQKPIDINATLARHGLLNQISPNQFTFPRTPLQENMDVYAYPYPIDYSDELFFKDMQGYLVRFSQKAKDRRVGFLFASSNQKLFAVVLEFTGINQEILTLRNSIGISKEHFKNLYQNLKVWMIGSCSQAIIDQFLSGLSKIHASPKLISVKANNNALVLTQTISCLKTGEPNRFTVSEALFLPQSRYSKTLYHGALSFIQSTYLPLSLAFLQFSSGVPRSLLFLSVVSSAYFMSQLSYTTLIKSFAFLLLAKLCLHYRSASQRPWFKWMLSKISLGNMVRLIVLLNAGVEALCNRDYRYMPFVWMLSAMGGATLLEEGICTLLPDIRNHAQDFMLLSYACYHTVSHFVATAFLYLHLVKLCSIAGGSLNTKADYTMTCRLSSSAWSLLTGGLKARFTMESAAQNVDCIFGSVEELVNCTQSI